MKIKQKNHSNLFSKLWESIIHDALTEKLISYEKQY